MLAALNIYENLAGQSANNSPSQDGTTPLFMASQNGHNNIVNILLANGADVNKRGFKVLFQLILIY